MRLRLVFALMLAQSPSAAADALWDFYFGPDAAVCGHVGALPEVAVATAHRLPLTTNKGGKLVQWFAAHPEYADEIAEYRDYYRQFCRPE